MILFITIYSFLSVMLYSLLLLYYCKGIKNTALVLNDNSIKPLFISIVVCFRNEEKHLPELLDALLNQDYPSDKYEIILYNDASDDGSVAIVKNYTAKYPQHRIILRNVVLKNGQYSAKKVAISDAVALSTADWILVTDADCSPAPSWVSVINQAIANSRAQLIAGPVFIRPERHRLNKIQYTELLTLNAVSAGSMGLQVPLMCNGANLAFSRDMFIALQPYSNNYHIPSGDDMFLLLAVLQHQNYKTTYLAHEHALVYTHAQRSLADYMNQKTRWASKSKYYAAASIKRTALIVFNANLALLCSLLLLLNVNLFFAVAAILIIKSYADWVCAKTLADKTQTPVLSFVDMATMQYAEALLTIVVAAKSVFGSYIWKGRKQQI